MGWVGRRVASATTQRASVRDGDMDEGKKPLASCDTNCKAKADRILCCLASSVHTLSLSSFHAPFCSALGCLFIYFSLSFFLSFSSHFSSPLHEEEGRNQEPVPCIAVPPRALRIGNLALLKLACALLFASPSWFRALRCWTVAPRISCEPTETAVAMQRDAVDVCCRTD